MDEADAAADYQARLIEAGVAAVTARPRELPREENGVRACLRCGEPIEAARLAALPAAVRCVECEQEMEAWTTRS